MPIDPGCHLLYGSAEDGGEAEASVWGGMAAAPRLSGIWIRVFFRSSDT